MITGWRGSYGDDAPVEFQCEEFGWPHKTTTGEQMYENTHFRTIEEAWDNLKKNAEAQVYLSGQTVNQARYRLAEAEKHAANAAARYARITRGIWEAETSGK
jgi:hypothetical protein